MEITCRQILIIICWKSSTISSQLHNTTKSKPKSLTIWLNHTWTWAIAPCENAHTLVKFIWGLRRGLALIWFSINTAHSPSSHPISKHFQKFPSVCGGHLMSVKQHAGFCIHSIQSRILQTIINQCLQIFYLVYAISRYGQICSTSTTTSGCNTNVVEFDPFFACSHLWWPKEEIAESKWNMEDLLFLGECASAW